MFPALVFHLTFMAAYPASLDQNAADVLDDRSSSASPWLMVVYIIVLFAMIIQTCAACCRG